MKLYNTLVFFVLVCLMTNCVSHLKHGRFIFNDGFVYHELKIKDSIFNYSFRGDLGNTSDTTCGTVAIYENYLVLNSYINNKPIVVKEFIDNNLMIKDSILLIFDNTNIPQNDSSFPFIVLGQNQKIYPNNSGYIKINREEIMKEIEINYSFGEIYRYKIKDEKTNTIKIDINFRNFGKFYMDNDTLIITKRGLIYPMTDVLLKRSR